jgi:hypothetical protein
VKLALILLNGGLDLGREHRASTDGACLVIRDGERLSDLAASGVGRPFALKSGRPLPAT